MSERKGRGKTSAEKIKKKMDKGEDVQVHFDVDGRPAGENARSWINWLGNFTREHMDCDKHWDEVDKTEKDDWWKDIKVQFSFYR
jgi:hypothetical protein